MSIFQLRYTKECFPALLLKELQADGTIGSKILSVQVVTPDTTDISGESVVVGVVGIVGDGLTNDDKKIVDGIVAAHKKTTDFPIETPTVHVEDRG